MDHFTSTIIIIQSLVIIVLIIVYLYKKKKNKEAGRLECTNIIQKNINASLFNTDGYLIAASPLSESIQCLFNLKQGEHITDFTHFKNIDKYFESCKKFKKMISLKLYEEKDNNINRRHDLIFSPFFKDDTLFGIIVISQELYSRNSEELHLNQQKELEEQRNYALQQIDEIEAQKSELELAFKKSSKHHIMLQKALRQIETQKSELENALSTINEQKVKLEKANKEIKQSSKLKEIFLANTSHEIRTPLNAIMGFTNLLFNTELSETQNKYLENIRASGNNLLVVIKDILDFSKIESGKLTLEKIEFEIRTLITHTINTLSVKSQEKNIEIKYDVSEDIPQVIIGDPVRLNQILINLLGNAIKFTNENGKVKMLCTIGQPVGDRIKLLFKIEDNGIGIPKDKLQYIFQSFTQGESDTTRKYGGTGLGLSIVKQLIELQDGEISVDSEVNKGTAFTFYILLKEGDSSKLTNTILNKNTISSDQSDNINVLLVEDNIINQQLAVDTISSWNQTIKVEIAENGAIALQKVNENHYDLILMDIQMPEMDGNEATIAIRKLEKPKCDIPIIAMTAHALKNEKENCLQLGMNDYISKPFDPDDLFSKILFYSKKNKKGENPRAVVEKIIDEHSFYKGMPLNTTKKDYIQSYQHIDLKSLEKIYQNNTEKIVKIVSMCYNSIPSEIEELKASLINSDFDGLKNKAHTLKPKLGYLGINNMQENAKQIELLSKDKDEIKIGALINEIDEYWSKASSEIKQFIENN